MSFDDYVVKVGSFVHGTTTDIPGRYRLKGETFSITSDAGIRAGGLGEQPSALDLLVSSLVSCALDSFRQQLIELRGTTPRIDLYSRVERDTDSEILGVLIIEFFVEELSDQEAQVLTETFRSRCRIYQALQEAFPVVFIPHADALH